MTLHHFISGVSFQFRTKLSGDHVDLPAALGTGSHDVHLLSSLLQSRLRSSHRLELKLLAAIVSINYRHGSCSSDPTNRQPVRTNKR